MSILQQFKELAHSEWRQMKPGLERIYQACKSLDHPERQFRSIHVAGTNGKGSTVAMLHSVLTEAGYKVGRFTSPHLVRVNERFLIGEEEIPDEELEEILGVIVEKLDLNLLPFVRGGVRWGRSITNLSSTSLESPPYKGGENTLTFFELCTLVAFLYFAKHKVDIALVEVGLGGRLDSTNIITPLLSIITEISLDHTEVLGSDLASIAKEKAGIIKYKTPLVSGVTDPEARKAIEQIAAEKEAPVHQVQTPKILLGNFFDWKKYLKLQTNLLGSHQIQNAAVALTALEILSDKGYLIREQSIRRGLTAVQWPARLEFVENSLLDGAHNPSGIESLVRYLKESQSNRKWKVLFSAVQGKAVSEMLSLLSSVAEEIVICRIDNPRSIDPEEVVSLITRRNDEAISSEEINPTELPRFARNNKKIEISHLPAFETYQKISQNLQSDESLLVTGSLYLIGEIKEKLAKI